ncbi:MAG TPA: MarC family NAAT transporter [Pseudomonadales bacterium]|nr:MarC family NAAT transporter [Pseudomonadales bacterium]
MLHEWMLLVAGTALALLPIANPISTAPIFVTLTRGYSKQRRLQQARMACVWMATILIVSLLAGALILEFFGVSLPALRFAGGLVVAQIGLGMMRSEPASQADLSAESAAEVRHMADISFTPLAMPMLSGPGSIAVTISMATEVDRPAEYLAVAIGIVVVAGIALLVLRGATRVGAFLGVTGLDALNRLMGFLLICIGVQFMGTAIQQALSSPEFVEAIARGLESVRA